MTRHFMALKVELFARGITISELADAIGRSTSYVSSILTGRSDWRLGEVYKVMDVLDVPYDMIGTYFPKDGLSAEPVDTRRRANAIKRPEWMPERVFQAIMERKEAERKGMAQ